MILGRTMTRSICDTSHTIIIIIIIIVLAIIRTFLNRRSHCSSLLLHGKDFSHLCLDQCTWYSSKPVVIQDPHAIYPYRRFLVTAHPTRPATHPFFPLYCYNRQLLYRYRKAPIFLWVHWSLVFISAHRVTHMPTATTEATANLHRRLKMVPSQSN